MTKQSDNNYYRAIKYIPYVSLDMHESIHSK